MFSYWCTDVLLLNYVTRLRIFNLAYLQLRIIHARQGISGSPPRNPESIYPSSPLTAFHIFDFEHKLCFLLSPKKLNSYQYLSAINKHNCPSYSRPDIQWWCEQHEFSPSAATPASSPSSFKSTSIQQTCDWREYSPELLLFAERNGSLSTVRRILSGWLHRFIKVMCGMHHKMNPPKHVIPYIIPKNTV